MLILPNFARGLASGIMGVIAVLAISANILNEKTSSIVNVVMQIAMFLGNLLYIFTCKKCSSKVWVFISTIRICVMFPLCVLGGKVWFFVTFFIQAAGLVWNHALACMASPQAHGITKGAFLCGLIPYDCFAINSIPQQVADSMHGSAVIEYARVQIHR